MPYQSSGGRRNNVQIGVGHSVWGGSPPPPVSERTLDGIPGCLAWVALLLSVAAAVAFPYVILILAVLLGLYSAIRFLFAGIANVMGLRHITEWEATDWYTRYQQDADSAALDWDDVHHIVIIPNYKESLATLRTTLDRLAEQYQAQRRISIVLAMEAAEDGAVEKGTCLQSEYAGRFANIDFTVHPRGLPGEMQCKSANEAWAARWIKRKLVDDMGYDIDHLLVTTMDADTLWHTDYFYALTYLFAVHPDRHLRFWQAPIRYHTNIWEISPPMRLINAYSGAFELAYLAGPWWVPMPMSSYTLSLRLLDSSGYWDGDVIADEWHMFIKAYFARDGDVKLERVFLPFSAYATTGETLWDVLKNRYLQTLRHAWGSKELGYMLAKMLEHPEIDFGTSFKLLFRVAHDILLAGAGWVILTIGSQFTFLIHPEILVQLSTENIHNPIFVALQATFLLISILSVVFWYQDVIVRPPRPRDHPQTLTERLLTVASFPVLLVLTLIFVALPTLQAQTRLLVGIPLQFRVTRKI
ncbi:MAG: glycosyltransferase family 2 protein [Anaerolineae bacterium]|nr:glycosyltransferase family 2 protein [Anaerolineae bacterium]